MLSPLEPMEDSRKEARGQSLPGLDLKLSKAKGPHPRGQGRRGGGWDTAEPYGCAAPMLTARAHTQHRCPCGGQGGPSILTLHSGMLRSSRLRALPESTGRTRVRIQTLGLTPPPQVLPHMVLRGPCDGQGCALGGSGRARDAAQLLCTCRGMGMESQAR